MSEIIAEGTDQSGVSRNRRITRLINEIRRSVELSGADRIEIHTRDKSTAESIPDVNLGDQARWLAAE